MSGITAGLRRRLGRALSTALGAGTGPHDPSRLIQDIRRSRLTYLSEQRLSLIAKICAAAEETRLPGVFIEAGCALGGSTILISKMKSTDRVLRVYDVFKMIPPPGPNDGEDVHARYQTIASGHSPGIGSDKYYGYEADLYAKVCSNIDDFGINRAAWHVELIKGLLQDTMHVNEPVAFAHVDVDWYEPVRACLERIVPRLVPGGSIVLDDYHDWSGCRQAADEYFGAAPDSFVFDDSSGSRHVRRIR